MVDRKLLNSPNGRIEEHTIATDPARRQNRPDSAGARRRGNGLAEAGEEDSSAPGPIGRYCSISVEIFSCVCYNKLQHIIGGAYEV